VEEVKEESDAASAFKKYRVHCDSGSNRICGTAGIYNPTPGGVSDDMS